MIKVRRLFLQHFKKVYQMNKTLKLDQSKLLGFKIQMKKAGEGIKGLGAKIGGAKVGFIKG